MKKTLTWLFTTLLVVSAFAQQIPTASKKSAKKGMKMEKGSHMMNGKKMKHSNMKKGKMADHKGMKKDAPN